MDLTLSAGTLAPGFDSGTTSYNVEVLNANDTITLTPTVSQANATVTVNGDPVVSGVASNNIALSVGDNVIDVVVTAEDNSFTETYEVTVRRQSADASLSALSLSEGVLDPVFDTLTTSYSTVDSVIGEDVEVTATPTNANATIEYSVNGNALANSTIPLDIDGNTIEITVTSEDLSTTQTYTIAVDRLSNIADLSALGLSADTSLSPVFASGTFDYDVTIGNGTGSMTVTPTLADSNATMTVEGTPLASGATSPAVTTPEGSIVDIEIEVTAEDGVDGTNL